MGAPPPRDAPDIDEDVPCLGMIHDSCQQTRCKNRNWIESGAMKVGGFQKAIGVSPRGYQNFMNRSGTWDGEGCDAYPLGAAFFKKHKLQGLPLQAPKSQEGQDNIQRWQGEGQHQDTQAQFLDVSGVEIRGEKDIQVGIYDTCHEARKKIRVLVAKGVTQAALTRTLGSMYPEDSGRKVSPANLGSLAQKGPLAGNTSTAFYASCVFEKKRRLREGKPKSKFREQMEYTHGRDGGIGVTPSDRSRFGW